mgnify:CR=1 FL=1
MKSTNCIILMALMLLSASCIRKEPLNAECDIISASLPGDVLNREPIITNDKVTFIVKNGTDIAALAPTFELTPGAVINPPSGTMLDFRTPQTYVVTSEDRQWQKSYTVEVQMNNAINLTYDFENVRVVNGKSILSPYSYDVFYEMSQSGHETLTWASGNAGFALTGLGSTPSTFPTFQTDGGVTGKCAAMITKSTGAFGSMANKPMAAGSLFIGKFDVTNAMARPLEATMFGTPFYNVPRTLKGFYKYTPGPVYYQADGGKLVPVEGKTDKFNIYAVFFEAVTGMEMLNGTNALDPDNPNVIAVAEIPDADRVAAADWKAFSIPFVFRPGKTVDAEKLQNGAYSITIVFSSSTDGDFFSGAIDSQLLIDQVSLECYSAQ